MPLTMGCTFDISLQTTDEGILEAKAMSGDVHLGRDFDSRIVMGFINESKRKHKMDTRWNAGAVHLLWTACECRSGTCRRRERVD